MRQEFSSERKANPEVHAVVPAKENVIVFRIDISHVEVDRPGRGDGVVVGLDVIAELDRDAFPDVPLEAELRFDGGHERTEPAGASRADQAIGAIVGGGGLDIVEIHAAFDIALEGKAADRSV